MNSPLHRGVLVSLLLLPAAALAHTGPEASSFMYGLAHPIGGLDHLLAMIAVGVIASRMEGLQRWSLPIAFLCWMAIGAALGAGGISLPLVEAFIALSLVALGGAIISKRQPSLSIATIVASGFALFHGHAHGSEMIVGSALTYGAGFIASTAMLHAVGLCISLRAQVLGEKAKKLVRVGGGLIAATGIALLSVAG